MKNLLRLCLLIALVFLGAKVLSTDFDKMTKPNSDIVLVENN